MNIKLISLAIATTIVGFVSSSSNPVAARGNDFVYLMKNGNLYGAPLNGLQYPSRLQTITTGGWKGEFTVNEGYVYLMKKGNLYGAPLNGLQYPSQLKTITTGGWTGKFTTE